jgi:hypothetical protein
MQDYHHVLIFKNLKRKMKISITTLDGNVYSLEVSDDLEILNLKALCEQETNVPVSEMSLTFNGRPLNDDTRTVASYSLKDNDMIMVQRMKNSSLPFIDFSSISVPQSQTSSSELSTNTAGLLPVIININYGFFLPRPIREV